MFILELITPVGIVVASFNQEVKRKDGGKEVLNLPYVFKNKEVALEFLEKQVKGKVFGYNIKEFNPFDDSKI